MHRTSRTSRSQKRSGGATLSHGHDGVTGLLLPHSNSTSNNKSPHTRPTTSISTSTNASTRHHRRSNSGRVDLNHNNNDGSIISNPHSSTPPLPLAPTLSRSSSARRRSIDSRRPGSSNSHTDDNLDNKKSSTTTTSHLTNLSNFNTQPTTSSSSKSTLTRNSSSSRLLSHIKNNTSSQKSLIKTYPKLTSPPTTSLSPLTTQRMHYTGVLHRGGRLEINQPDDDRQSTNGRHFWDQYEAWNQPLTDVQQNHHWWHMRKLNKRIFKLQQLELENRPNNFLERTLSDSEQEKLRLRLHVHSQRYRDTQRRDFAQQMYWRAMRYAYKRHGQDDFMPKSYHEKLRDLRRRVYKRRRQDEVKMRQKSGNWDGAREDGREQPDDMKEMDDFLPIDMSHDDINPSTYRQRRRFQRNGQYEKTDDSIYTEDQDTDGAVISMDEFDKPWGPFGHGLQPDIYDKKLMWWFL